MGHCYNSVVINAPTDKVWNMIKDFHSLSWGEPVITKLEKLNDLPGSEVGAQRRLNEAFCETLLTIDHDHCTFSYSIDDGPGPVAKEAVNNYIGQVSLRPITDTGDTFIEWSSTFESATPDEVTEFCNPIYAALLEALKGRF